MIASHEGATPGRLSAATPVSRQPHTSLLTGGFRPPLPVMSMRCFAFSLCGTLVLNFSKRVVGCRISQRVLGAPGTCSCALKAGCDDLLLTWLHATV